jgi:aminopeptidase N
MNSDRYYPIKVEILHQISSVSFDEKKNIIKAALQSLEVKVRQAVAETVENIPIDYKNEYETLLNDDSYNTKEIAFVNLWNNFPDEQSKYLEIAKDWKGNNDKSLRILYLSYVQQSNSLSDKVKNDLYTELINYTYPTYESSIRQNAIEASLSINPKDEIALKNLIRGTTHFRWQFSKYSKDKIRELVKNTQYKLLFKSISLVLPENEQFQLQRIIGD